MFFQRLFRRLNFIYNFLKFKKKEVRFSVFWKDRHPCLSDASKETLFDPHYIYHSAWAARILSQTKPKKHVDIGSALNWNVIISAFVPIEFYDYRPANVYIDNMSSKRADITKLAIVDESVCSVSSMHVIEHIGLGRYGDQVNHKGDIEAISEIKRIVKPMGDILFVVPVGKPRIMYNAHRIYSYEQIVSYFKDSCELKDFFLIPDNGVPIKKATARDVSLQKYGCGCFWFKKNDHS